MRLQGDIKEKLKSLEAGGCKYSCYTTKVTTKKGTEYYRLFCGKQDKKCKPYKQAPKSEITTIEETTKPSGSGSHWIEVGHFEIDDFGDKIWKPNEYRYPQKDPRLNVKRKYEGKGKMQNIHWIIQIPPEYPDCIQVVGEKNFTIYSSGMCGE